jgi:hypothetical protein
MLPFDSDPLRMTNLCELRSMIKVVVANEKGM